MASTRICFNCGIPISRKEGNETVEHIPLQSLFHDLGPEYKINRITVPCCLTCNKDTSQTIDEEFRNFIGSIVEGRLSMPLADKTIRSVLDHKKQFDRIVVDNYGNMGLKSEKGIVHSYAEKVFRGIFFHHYKRFLSRDFTIGIDIGDKEKTGDLSQPFMNYLLRNFEYKHSGSPDVFRYILQPYRKGFSQEKKIDLVPDQSDVWFGALMTFSNTFTVMAYASLTAKKKQ